MGVTVRQKKRGRGLPWWVFVHVNGSIRSKKIGDKRAAETVASAVRRKIKAGELNLPSPDPEQKSPRFGDYAERYIESYAKIACKFTTWRSYETIIEKHLNPIWRTKRLDQITRADVKRLILQKQQDGFAVGTVENIKALVSGIFTHAYEDEILSVHPALRLGRFIQKTDRRQHVRPLTREQARAFLDHAREHYPDHYPLLLCAFRTGMRMGEVLGLAWDDIDFEGNVITVKRGYTHSRFTTPKSHKSRVVDMSDQLRAVLLDHRERLRVRFGGTLPVTKVQVNRTPTAMLRLVFPSVTGGPIDGTNFRHRVFYPLIEKANVPRVRFHDIRHTFASLLLQQGESLHYVKEQMGHASIQTTVDVYGHLVPGANRNAVNKLDDADVPTLRVRSGDAG